MPAFAYAQLPVHLRPSVRDSKTLLGLFQKPHKMKLEPEFCFGELTSVRRLSVSRSCQFLINYCPNLEYLQDQGTLYGPAGNDPYLDLDLSLVDERARLLELFIKQPLDETLILGLS